MPLRKTSVHGTSKRTTASTGSKDIACGNRLGLSLSPLPFGRIVAFGKQNTLTRLLRGAPRFTSSIYNCSSGVNGFARKPTLKTHFLHVRSINTPTYSYCLSHTTRNYHELSTITSFNGHASRHECQRQSRGCRNQQ